MNKQVLDYYTKHNCITDPGKYAAWLDALPTDLTDLHTAINGLLIHIWKIRKYHSHLLESRSTEVFIRHTQYLLEEILKLDDRPFNVARPVEKQVIIDCRHFSTFLCSILRQQGIPARARCGFAAYLEDGFCMDHWVCEYWNSEQGRWITEDPDKKLHDVPPDQFITGARAWQLCRADDSAGSRFGFNAEARGMWAARVNLVRDFAALNGFESVSGDGWGLAMKTDADVTVDDTAILDQAARLAVTDNNFEERHSFYEETETLRAPTIISNFDYVKSNDWRMVEWQKEP